MPEHASVVVTADDDGRVIRVPLGAQIAVRLSENASTGFRWAVERPARRILRPIAGADPSPPAEAAGTAGTHAFLFRAAAPGRGRLRFKLWRPWEGEDSIARHLTVTVLVEQTQADPGPSQDG